jgi:hypothetical protein
VAADGGGVTGEDDLVVAGQDFRAFAERLALVLHEVDVAGGDERFEVFLFAEGGLGIAGAFCDDDEAVAGETEVGGGDDDLVAEREGGFRGGADHFGGAGAFDDGGNRGDWGGDGSGRLGQGGRDRLQAGSEQQREDEERAADHLRMSFNWAEKTTRTWRASETFLASWS